MVPFVTVAKQPCLRNCSIFDGKGRICKIIELVRFHFWQIFFNDTDLFSWLDPVVIILMKQILFQNLDLFATSVLLILSPLLSERKFLGNFYFYLKTLTLDTSRYFLQLYTWAEKKHMKRSYCSVSQTLNHSTMATGQWANWHMVKVDNASSV